MAEEERFGFSAINASRCLCSALRARAAEKHGPKNASHFLNGLRISSDEDKNNKIPDGILLFLAEEERFELSNGL